MKLGLLEGMEAYLLAGSLLYFLTQVAASHVFGLRLAEDAEHGWCDVAKSAAGLKADVIVVCDKDEGNGICGVIGMRSAGCGIDHGFSVAVVGGDDPSAAAGLQRLIDAREAGVDRLAGFDGGVGVTRMARPVRLWVIFYYGGRHPLFSCVFPWVGGSFAGAFPFQL